MSRSGPRQQLINSVEVWTSTAVESSTQTVILRLGLSIAIRLKSVWVNTKKMAQCGTLCHLLTTNHRGTVNLLHQNHFHCFRK